MSLPVAAEVDPGHPRFGLIANLDNRRASFFCDAVVGAGFDPPVCVGWDEVVDDGTAIDRLRSCHLVRLDSAGENAEVSAALVKLGTNDPGPPLDFGEVRHIDASYRGFSTVLARLANAGLVFTNHPDEVAVMFDKLAGHRRLVAAGAPRPQAHGLDTIGDGMSAVEAIAELGLGSRVFVKARYGSSASGVCALTFTPRGVQLIAPIRIGPSDPDLGRPRLFNSLRITNHINADDVQTILASLIAEGVVVEPWIPKAELDGQRFDLRIVTIGGEARHSVIRSSSSPMTNLHLGNKRGDWASFHARYGREAKREACRVAELAASAFPRSLVAGVDVMFDRAMRPYVVEINAFGDLLPGVIDRGQSTYEAVVAAMASTASTVSSLPASSPTASSLIVDGSPLARPALVAERGL